MNAVLWTAYGPPEVLQPGELPTPEPKANQVRIRVHATAVTYSDCFARALAMPAPIRSIARLILGWNRPRKKVSGIIFSGVIDRVGANVRTFREGQHVFGLDPFGAGCYAEYKCIKETGALALKPESLSHSEAAAIPYGGLLALGFLKASGIETKRKVLIYGAAGAVGSSAVQLAKHFGADVTAMCSARNLELVQSLGADRVLEYTTPLPDRYDLIFVAITRRYGPPTREQCRDALLPGGVYSSIAQRMPKMDRARMELLEELVEAGKLKPVIDRTYPLSRLAEAHRYVETERKRGVVVIDVP